MCRVLLLLALVLIGLPSCRPNKRPAADPTQRLNLEGEPNPDPIAPGTYVHPGSDLRFPLALPGFRRGRVAPYNHEETDVGVAYISAAAPRLVFTVYVYPRAMKRRGVPYPSATHFERELEEVRKGRPDIKELSRGTLEGTLAKRAVKGHAAEFKFAGGTEFGGHRVGSVISVFPFGHWQIKYRITWPVAERADSLKAAEALLAALGFPPTGVPAQWGPVRR